MRARKMNVASKRIVKRPLLNNVTKSANRRKRCKRTKKRGGSDVKTNAREDARILKRRRKRYNVLLPRPRQKKLSAPKSIRNQGKKKRLRLTKRTRISII